MSLLDLVLGEVLLVKDLPLLADVKFLGTVEPLVAVRVSPSGVEGVRVGRGHRVNTLLHVVDRR